MGMLEFPRSVKMKGGRQGREVGLQSYRFNDQFDIKTSFPKKKKASDQQQEEKNSKGENITNFQFKVLPADSPSPQLHKTGSRRTVRGGEGGANEKEPKINSSPFTLNTCKNRPRHFFSFLKTIHIISGSVIFSPFVLTQSVKTAAVNLHLR